MCFFLKVAIASDLLLLCYSGAYEILSTDFHNWRQPGTGRWGKWDTPSEENTQTVSDLRWLLGLSRAAGSQGIHLLCKCLAQEAPRLFCFGPMHKVLMPTNMTWCLCSYDILCSHPGWTVAWSLLPYRLCLTSRGAITQSIRWDGSVLWAPGSVSYLFAPLPCLPAPQEWVVSGVPVKLAVTDTYCQHPGIPCHSRTTGTRLKIVLFTCTFPSNPSFSWYCLMWSKPLPITYSLSTLSLVGSDESPSLLFWACRSPRDNTVPAQWWQLNYNNFSAFFAAQIQYLWHY